MRCIGVFGGTFDPVHLGHLAMAEGALRELALDEMRLVPCRQPPHKSRQGLTPGPDRLAMIALATQDRPGLVPNSWELVRGTPSYTVETLDGMRAAAPDHRFFFLMGLDSFRDLGTWKDHARLVSDYHLAVVNRPGVSEKALSEAPPGAVERIVRGAAQRLEPEGRVHLLKLPEIAVSSSEIRDRARSGGSLAGLVAPPVESYIQKCALYRL